MVAGLALEKLKSAKGKNWGLDLNAYPRFAP